MTALAPDTTTSGGPRWLRLAPLAATVAVALLTRLSWARDPQVLIALIVGIVSIGSACAQLARGWGGGLVRRLVASLAGISATVIIVAPGLVRRVLMADPTFLGFAGSAVALHLLWGVHHLLRSPAPPTGDFRQRAEALLSSFFPQNVAMMAAAELSVLYYALAWTKRPDVPTGAHAFTYHKNMQLLVWGVLFAAVLEVVATHIVISIWSPKAAWITSLLSEVGVIYLLGLINSFAKLPILLTREGLRVRAGLILDLVFRFEDIESVEGVLNCGNLKRPGFLKASLLAYPNVIVRLRRPVTVKRPFRKPVPVEILGLHPDDLSTFVHELRALLQPIASLPDSGHQQSVGNAS